MEIGSPNIKAKRPLFGAFCRRQRFDNNFRRVKKAEKRNRPIYGEYNRKSANEGNVKYLGEIINHQWTKSSEFEKKFRYYCKKYLVKNVNYFSFTRKYGELEISKMLIKYPKYFPVFSSCNAGMRIKIAGEARWCGNCPKCLFIYMSLYPLLKKKKMLEIFGKDIFENRGLLPI